MAKQATHRGECQMCGRMQKLPGGKLAKHGYTTRWGFFSGVCRGAGHLPYEQSCDMLRELLPTVRDSVNLQRQLAVTARETTGAAWVVEVHQPPNARSYADQQTVSRLVPVEELTLENHYGAGRLTWKHSKPEMLVAHYPARKDFGYGKGLTMAAAVALLNEDRALGHDAQARRLQEYADWCAERIAKWKVRELRPIRAEDEAPKSPACPKCGSRRSRAARDGQRRCGTMKWGSGCGVLYTPDEKVSA